MYDRLPPFMHLVLDKIKEKCTLCGKHDWGRILSQLKATPEFRELSKKQKFFFKHNFKSPKTIIGPISTLANLPIYQKNWLYQKYN